MNLNLLHTLTEVLKSKQIYKFFDVLSKLLESFKILGKMKIGTNQTDQFSMNILYSKIIWTPLEQIPQFSGLQVYKEN